MLVSWVFRLSQQEFSFMQHQRYQAGTPGRHGPKWGNNQAFAWVMAGIFNDGVEIAQIRVLARCPDFSGAGPVMFCLGIYMGLSENSVPLHPMVNDHYPY